MSKGYYRWPTVHGDRVTFVCEDDLWTVPLSGGEARRLTAGLGQAACPRYSPDGRLIAFTGSEGGHQEVYLMPAEGGPARRLTYLGALTHVVGWTPDGSAIICRSSARQVMLRMMELYAVRPEGGPAEPLGFGIAHDIAYGPAGGILVGRHTLDPARWKRYRGGTTGDLWIDPDGTGAFRRLIRPDDDEAAKPFDGNIGSPMWIGDRIYFLADHEGIGNLYSCSTAGDDLRRHTAHTDYYARFASTDGRTIVYHAGADLFAHDVASGATRPIEVTWHSPQVQRSEKFVPAAPYLTDYALHPKGHSIALTVRGKPFTMGLWEGAVMRQGEAQGVRYRFAQYLPDGEKLVTVCDAAGEEAVEVHCVGQPSAVVAPPPSGAPNPSPLWGEGEGRGLTPSPSPLPGREGVSPAGVPPSEEESASSDAEHLRAPPGTGAPLLDIGRPDELAASPTAAQAALVNHRRELILVDLDQRTMKVLDRSENHGGIEGLAWSPDGAWLAYAFWDSPRTSIIKVCRPATGETRPVTRPVLRDFAPAFDPDGRHLYFLSSRDFNPVYDEVQFELGFPRGTRPYLVTLRRDVRSPFVPEPRPPGEPSGGAAKPGEGEKPAGQKPQPIEIDFEGIEDRIAAFPVAEGRYRQLAGLGRKVLYTVWPVEGSLGRSWMEAEPEPRAALKAFDFLSQEEETLLTGVSDFALSADRKTMAVRAGRRLRVLPAGEKPKHKGGDGKPGRKSGWLDLNRLKVAVSPPHEWRQMLGEAWRRMRDHFWTPDMSAVDWRAIYQRYLPLLDRVACRSEFSDLLWEMQGELGTSHAYEFGGDYRPAPAYRQGFLGADFAWDGERGGYRIVRLVEGDVWSERAGGPLARPGLNVRVGDVVTAVNGRPLSATVTPQEALVNCADTDVLVTVAGADGSPGRALQVKALADEMPARYRDWVAANRERVHAATGGRVGYVHVPDMGPAGFAEFHRAFLAECQRDALLVDVRGNGGGHVSSLLLEKLARKRLGYDVPRWGKPEPFPDGAVLGPMAAVTNELAGSDGDIFSHCFKLMRLGPLIGRRTWGGVIGINARCRLVDGTLVTQPEYAFWFSDVGWRIENRGAEPDIPVDDPPHDYKAGRDAQLERAIAELVRLLDEARPAVPDFADRPSRRPPSTLGG